MLVLVNKLPFINVEINNTATLNVYKNTVETIEKQKKKTIQN